MPAYDAPMSEAIERWTRRQQRMYRKRVATLLFLLPVPLVAGGWLIAGPAGAVASLIGTAVAWRARPRLPIIAVIAHFRARPLDQVFGAAPLIAWAVELAERARVRPPRLYGTPSSAANAFALVSENGPALMISDGLLRTLDHREMRAVMAHEISHIAARDIDWALYVDGVVRMTWFVALLGIALWLFGPYPPFVGRSMEALALFGAIPVAAALMRHAEARRREYQADIGSVALTGDPVALARALEKVDYATVARTRRWLFPKAAVETPVLLRSHPPIDQRVRRLMRIDG